VAHNSTAALSTILSSIVILLVIHRQLKNHAGSRLCKKN
jgi:hypothetical protein